MKPIKFEQATKVLQKPGAMTDDECSALHVWSDGKQCVSCWKASLKERLFILFTGKVYLSVLSGKTQPPVWIAGERVFTRTPFKARVKCFISEWCDSIKDTAKALWWGCKQADKRKHFLCGFAISFVVSFIHVWFGVLSGCVAGFLKEWYDSKGNGQVEMLDFVFTCLGAISAIPTSLLMMVVFNEFVQSIVF